LSQNRGTLKSNIAFRSNLNVVLARDRVNASKRAPLSKWSKCSYSPIRLDPSYGNPRLRDNSDQIGRDSLGPDYTSTSMLGQTAVRALNRHVATTTKPFLLSVNFNAPVSLHQSQFRLNVSFGELFFLPRRCCCFDSTHRTSPREPS
jgi:hypothetical protein